MKQIARELGCSATSLAEWKYKYDDPLEGCIDPEEATPEELKRENARLLKELNIVKEEREILKKSCCHFGTMKTSEIYKFITEPVVKGHSAASSCRLMEVSQSGYNASLKRPASLRERRRKDLTDKVIHIFHEHESRYGRPRIYRQLKAQGEHVSEKMVGPIIRSEGLKARKKRPFRPKTTQQGNALRYAPNLLKNQTPLIHPNRILVSDVTHVATKQGWLYLAGIMDLKTRVIKGYSVAEEMPTSLISTALDQAFKNYPEMKGAILHSDRGCQYTSHSYLQKLKDLWPSSFDERERLLLR